MASGSRWLLLMPLLLLLGAAVSNATWPEDNHHEPPPTTPPGLLDLHPSLLLHPLLDPGAAAAHLVGEDALRLLLTSHALADTVPEPVKFHHFAVARLHLDVRVPASATRAFRDCLYLSHADQVLLHTILPAAVDSPISYCTHAVHNLTQGNGPYAQLPPGTFDPIPPELLLAAGYACTDRVERLPPWLLGAMPPDLLPYAQQALYFAQVRRALAASLSLGGRPFRAVIDAALLRHPALKLEAMAMLRMWLVRSIIDSRNAWVAKILLFAVGEARRLVPHLEATLQRARLLRRSLIALLMDAASWRITREQEELQLAVFQTRLRQLLIQGLDINAPLGQGLGEDSTNPFQLLLHLGKWRYVQVLVRHGRLLDALDAPPLLGKRGRRAACSTLPPLLVALESEDADLVAYLLQVGADPNARADNGDRAVHRCIHSASTPLVIVQRLLQYGADLSALNPDGAHVLHAAVCLGNVAVLAFLLAEVRSGRMAPPPPRTPTGSTLLMLACAHAPLSLPLLLDSGLPWVGAVEERDHLGKTCLVYAIEQGSQYWVRELVERYGASVHGALPPPPAWAAFLSGWRELRERSKVDLIQPKSPLLTACRLGRLDMARYLLDQGADVETMEADTGWNCLALAAAGEDLELLHELLRRGARLAGPWPWGDPLLLAARCPDVQLMHALVEEGRRREGTGHTHPTTLLRAAQAEARRLGNEAVVAYLGVLLQMELPASESKGRSAT